MKQNGRRNNTGSRVILAVLLLVLLYACSVPAKIKKTALSNPVIAHRGAFKKNGFPENSIASLREAIRLGCGGSEFDVRMTADDSLVINHDPEFHHLSIEQSTYAQLQAFSLSNGEKIPTLQEYLAAGLANNPHTRLICEIKPSTVNTERGQRIAAKVVELVERVGASSRVDYISFDYAILQKIISVNPKAHTQYLDGNKAPAELAKDKIAGADYHYSVFKNKPEWITEANKHNIVLNAWTVNDTATMHWLLDRGVQLITTNEPELLFSLLAERKNK